MTRVYIAKSNGITLKDHSLAVDKRGTELALRLNVVDNLRDMDMRGDITEDIIHLVLLAHDIGKACKVFQDYLYSHEDTQYHEGSGHKRFALHNEYAAFFIDTHWDEIATAYGIPPKSDWKEIIESVVLYHHGIRAEFAQQAHNEGHVKFSKKDLPGYDDKAMCMACKEIGIRGIGAPVKDPAQECDIRLFSYNGDFSCATKALVLRAILIHADHEVSCDEFCEPHDYEPFVREDFVAPVGYDIDRFNKQLDIAFDQESSNSNIYNATAGFGKTLLGLVKSLISNEHARFITPKQEICDTLFENIQKELVALSGVNSKFRSISVEVVYNGVRQRIWNANGDAFSDDDEARITVTTIDNLTQPVVCGKKGGLQYMMLTSYVVFDEYHELESESNKNLLFAFGLILHTRHMLRRQQILLSATPSSILYKWSQDGSWFSDAKFYPGKFSHYSAQHKCPYGVKVVYDHPEQLDADTFAIFNSIHAAQAIPDTICYNSSFIPEDRQAKRALIGSLYGVGCSIENKRTPVSSSPIIQASADYSARHMYESIFSPATTLQRIGRCNRHHEYDSATLRLIDSSDGSEKAAVKNQYSKSLRDKWRDFVIARWNGKSLKLDEMYADYNAFMQDNFDEMCDYDDKLIMEGYKSVISHCVPTRKGSTLKKTLDKFGSIEEGQINAICSNGNIRNPNPQFYYIVKEESSNRFYLFTESSEVLYRDDCGFEHYSKDCRSYLESVGHLLMDKVNHGDYDKLAEILGVSVFQPMLNDYQRKHLKEYLYDKKTILLFARNKKTPFPVRLDEMRYSHDKGIIKTINHD